MTISIKPGEKAFIVTGFPTRLAEVTVCKARVEMTLSNDGKLIQTEEYMCLETGFNSWKYGISIFRSKENAEDVLKSIKY